MHARSTLVLAWVVTGFAAVGGSIIGRAFGQRGLIAGAVIGGALVGAGVLFGAGIARRR